MRGVTTKSVTMTQYAQLKPKMWKGSKNARRPRMVIKHISVLNVVLKNMVTIRPNIYSFLYNIRFLSNIDHQFFYVAMFGMNAFPDNTS